MDNDLMARRLRPPSEPPRPQNGHSPLPFDNPPWAASPDSREEVPWDRPQEEPWPPTTTDEQPLADVWPPTPAQAYQAPVEVVEAVVEPLVEQQPVYEQPVYEQPQTQFQQPQYEQPQHRDEQPQVEQTFVADDANAVDAVDEQSWSEPAPWRAEPSPWDQPATVEHAWQESARPVAQPNPWQEPVAPVAQETSWQEPVAPVAQETSWQEPVTQSAPSVSPETTWLRPPWEDDSPLQPVETSSNGVSHAPYMGTQDEALEPFAPVQQTDDVVETPTEASVVQRAPWDKPAPAPWDTAGEVDDRPADMLDSYDEMIPVVTRFVAAANAQPAPTTPPAQDPYDADAPVLKDVEQSAPTSWPAWSPPAETDTSRAPVQPEFSGRVVGPTPPDDLFGLPAAVSEPVSSAEPVELEPEPVELEPETESTVAHAPITVLEAVAAPDAQVPAVFSTSPNMAQQPLVLRIELAIVDDSNRVRPVDAARRVGPALDHETDTETPTPRHPEFEPRSQVTLSADEEPNPEPAREAAAPVPADLPWALPTLEPHEPTAAQQLPQPEPTVGGSAPWTRPVQPVPAAPPALPAPTFTQPAQTEPSWADPNPTSAWTLQEMSPDPLAALPAATFTAPAQPVAPPQTLTPASPAYPVYTPDSQPAFESPTSAPAPAPESVPALTSAPARPAANAQQSDLWFLASEPDIATVDDAPTDAADSQPSSLKMAGLTIFMAVVVVLLVLVFIYMMTNLLR